MRDRKRLGRTLGRAEGRPAPARLPAPGFPGRHRIPGESLGSDRRQLPTGDPRAGLRVCRGDAQGVSLGRLDRTNRADALTGLRARCLSTPQEGHRTAADGEHGRGRQRARRGIRGSERRREHSGYNDENANGLPGRGHTDHVGSVLALRMECVRCGTRLDKQRAFDWQQRLDRGDLDGSDSRRSSSGARPSPTRRRSPSS